jgi:hypothetical protein
MPANQLVEQPIIAWRPEPPSPPRRQRRRAAKCARFALQHVEIMFEVEDLLVPLVAAFVARDAAALIAHFDVTRIKSHLDGLAMAISRMLTLIT